MSSPPSRTAANTRQVQWASGLNALAGLWLIISPFILGFAQYDPWMMWNDTAFGIVVAILAGIRAGGAYTAVWVSWINILIGIWLIVSAFLFARPSLMVPFWNNIGIGVIVVILGIISARGTHLETA